MLTLPFFPGGYTILSCSQAGVARSSGYGTIPAIHALKIRPFDVDGYHTPFSGVFLIGGGTPGKSGEVGVEVFGVAAEALGRKYAKKKVAHDLVYCVALNDYDVAGVGCANGKVLLLKVPSLEIAREVHRHTAPCRDVCFSDDGKLLASGGRDGLVIVSPVAGGKPHILQDHTAGVECVAYSHGGLLASGALDGKVRIHEGKSLRRTYQKLGAEVLSLAYAGDSDQRLFAGLADGKLVELDPDSAQHTVYSELNAPIFSMVALGNKLVLGLDGEVRVLDLSPTKAPSGR